MTTALFFALAGYFCGGVLFARLAADLFGKTAILRESQDGNPGAANAFTYGGFWCGALVLCGDLFKGFLPVRLYLKSAAASHAPLLLALVLAAPVIGHAFPLFYRFQGGKGIAVTFGCLLGLVPNWRPTLTLALTFLFFSLVVCIAPHSHRTAVTYLCAAILMAVDRVEPGVLLGFGLMTAVVLLRLSLSKEARRKPEVKLLWRS